jgi:hypothetical protein
MNQNSDPRSVPQLLTDLLGEVTTLFRKEAQLIRSEFSDKASQLQAGAGTALAGAICLLVALNVLAGALVIALAEFIGAGWAALVVGVVIAVIGVLLLRKGASDLSPSNLTPQRSMHQVAQDATLVREQVQ